ncbi:MAG: ABC transporter permease, partial [Bacteroidota bacterium]
MDPDLGGSFVNRNKHDVGDSKAPNQQGKSSDNPTDNPYRCKDNFALNQLSLLANQLQATFATIGIIGWIVGGFSLLVGGFGIANIMFVSVYERTPQIGVQMALGSQRSFVILQFLLESVVLSLLGGMMGLLAVAGLVAALNAFMDLGLTLMWH